MTRLLLAVAALAVLLVGCGGVDRDPILAEAAERTEAQGTGRFQLESVQKDASQSRALCTGEADYQKRSVRLECDLGRAGALKMIALGHDVYIRGFTDDDHWYKHQEPNELDDDSLASLSPQRLLAMLRAASSETERVGGEDVRGTPTVRYRLTVDCEQAQLGCATTAPVDVWIGEEGLVRRISAEDEAEKFTFEFFDFGADVAIEPPPAGDVVDEEDLPELVVPDQERDCTSEGSPITVGQATRALRGHGFDVERSEFGCSPGVAATLSSVDDAFFTCFVLADPGESAGVTDVVVLGRKPERVDRGLENLQCTLFVERTTDPAVERLDAAFAELEAAVHP